MYSFNGEMFLGFIFLIRVSFGLSFGDENVAYFVCDLVGFL